MKSLIATEENSQSSNNVGLDVEESFLDNLLTYAREEGDNVLKKRPECARCRFDIDSNLKRSIYLPKRPELPERPRNTGKTIQKTNGK